MKLLKTLILCLIIPMSGWAQTSLNYSLVRPNGGGDLVLLEIDLNTNSETVVATYPSPDLDDYDPSATSFAPYGAFCALMTGADEDVVSYTVFNASDGALDFTGMFSGYELFSIEYYDGKLYSLGRPAGDGNLSLLEKDIALGTETIVATYQASEIDDYDSDAITFDHDNGTFIVQSFNADYDVRVMGFSTATGDLEFSHTSFDYELFSIEYYDGKVYSLARPANDGDIILLSTDLATGGQTEIYTYPPSELDDYDYGATSFDSENGRFVFLPFDQNEALFIASIDVATGDIGYTYSSPNYELFSIETGGDGSVGLAKTPIDEFEFDIFPNPTTDQIQINTSLKYQSITVRGMTGKIVLSEATSLSTIDVSSLPAGKYWLTLNTTEGDHSVSFMKN